MRLTEQRRRDPGVLIAGGGIAAQRTVEGLRRLGYDGAVRVICDEDRPPYDRPPLSKQYLAGDLSADALRFRSDRWYADHGVELLLGARASALDVPGKQVVLESGGRLAFSELVIATGSTPRPLPGTGGFANVHTLRSVADAARLRETLATAGRLVVIGAGFVGLEVASTARTVGSEVTIIEAAPAPLAGILGPHLGAWFARLHRQEGVDVRVGARIARFRGGDAVTAVELQDGERIACGAVLVGIGTVPATGWLAGCGLGEGGVTVDAAGCTAIPSVYAAGDASRRFDPRRRAHLRTEHWEAAARQGAAVARAILGLGARPEPPPSFWTDQHGVRIQCLGDTEGADDVRIDGDPSARDFTATFTRRGRPIAALLVGRPHALPQMRGLIEPPHAHDTERTAA